MQVLKTRRLTSSAH
jgi:hypothetical protein